MFNINLKTVNEQQKVNLQSLPENLMKNPSHNTHVSNNSQTSPSGNLPKPAVTCQKGN